MPLYYMTKSRLAVFHRGMARLFAAAAARRPEAAQSLRPDGDVAMVAASLPRTLDDWRAVATAEPDAARAIKVECPPADSRERSNGLSRLHAPAQAELSNEDI